MIYLDNAATTPLLPAVTQCYAEALTSVYGNASATYTLGRQAKQALLTAKQQLAMSIGASADEIVITSGGTESNNTALYSLAYRSNKRHIITSNIEHPSVQQVMADLASKGFEITYLPVNEHGEVSVTDLQHAFREDTSFVSIMLANNEVGSRQPLADIAAFLADKDCLLHTDAVQAYAIEQIDVSQLAVDMLSVSAHKINGPKGIGFLYVRRQTPFKALLKGGNQENTRRSGTENVPAIVAFAKASQLLDYQQKQAHCLALKQYFMQQLVAKRIPHAINGSQHTIPTICNIWLPDHSAGKLLIQLDLAGIMVSAGSACSAGSLQPSRILQAMYPNHLTRAQESLRISFGVQNTFAEIDRLVEKLQDITV